MREPSSGGTGIRLNTANETFILVTPIKNSTIYIAICETANKDMILTIKSDKNATIRLEPGPAKATIAIPLLEFLKLYGLICTGFAKPTPKNSMQSEPIISRCAKGFKVSLP